VTASLRPRPTAPLLPYTTLFRSDMGRDIGAVGEDDDLGGAGDGVDADAAEDLALGLCHVGVAGADDAVHGSDGGGAAGECRHRSDRKSTRPNSRHRTLAHAAFCL